MECRDGYLVSFVEKSVEKYGVGRENLLSVLREINEEFGFVSGEAFIEIDRKSVV